MRARLAVLALAVVALQVPGAAGAAPIGPATTAASVPGPPDTVGSVYFSSTRTGNSDIFKVSADGFGGLRQLTYDNAADTDPAVSPAGLQVAFVSNRNGNDDIFVTSAEGGIATNVTNHFSQDHGPAWSPDGTKIVFSSTRDGNEEIYRMNADGSGLVRLTNDPAMDSEPSWSPDGQHIVFTRWASPSQAEVYRIDALAGANPVDLSNNVAEDRQPVYAPDGQHIVFVSNRATVGPGPVGDFEIWQMDANGGSPISLTNDAFFQMSPTFSPDGSQIAFTSGPDIYRMGADGSNPTVLTTNGSQPSWGQPVLPCGGQLPTVNGTTGDDVLTGTPGADVINGEGGDDVILGGGGSDIICGGSGTDTASYADHTADVAATIGGIAGGDGSSEDGAAGTRDTVQTDVENLIGGSGNDQLRGTSGPNTLTGGPGNDTVDGRYGNDVLVGDDGDDLLLGAEGVDRMRGLAGNDTLTGGEGGDSLDGGAGADVLNGGPGIDTVTYAGRLAGVVATIGAGFGDDGGTLDGPVGARDTIHASVERLIGGKGSDVLTGNDLDNRLTGGLGADELRGMSGADTLVADDGVADLVIDCGADTDPAAVVDGLDPTPVSCP